VQPTAEQKAAADSYYAEQGPPVITYYAPPMDYAYLYDWVPYPAVWSGLWFPGFFICRNFTTVVTVAPFPHHFHRAIVTDHFFDPVTRRAARVDHVFRNDHGVLRPQTLLRSDTGSTFRNPSEFRRNFRHEGSIGSPGRPVVPGGGRERNKSFAQNGINRGGAAASGHGSPGTSLSPGLKKPGMSKTRPHVIAPMQPGSFGRQSSRGGRSAVPSVPSVPQSNSGRQFAGPRSAPPASQAPMRTYQGAPMQPGSFGRQSSRGGRFAVPSVPSVPQSNSGRQFAGPRSAPPASQAPMRTYQGGGAHGMGGAGFGHGPGGGMHR
jgi:hypothetical protein